MLATAWAGCLTRSATLLLMQGPSFRGLQSISRRCLVSQFCLHDRRGAAAQRQFISTSSEDRPGTVIVRAALDSTKPLLTALTYYDGTPRSVTIQALPKSNLNKLETELRSLLEGHDGKAVDGAVIQLSSEGDALHVSLMAPSSGQAEELRSRIMADANRKQHHPHIAIDSIEEYASGASLMMITCTTHRPPGLGLRDVRLAAAIIDMAGPLRGGQLDVTSKVLCATIAKQHAQHRAEINSARSYKVPKK
jgi:pterin-4a-carbinolamine dehydratase